MCNSVHASANERRCGPESRLERHRTHLPPVQDQIADAIETPKTFARMIGGLDHRNVIRVWHSIREAARLVEPRPRFHDLRHTAASLWISEGSDVVYVSRVLGHSSPSITLDVYADLFDRARHEERATAALDRAFGGSL